MNDAPEQSTKPGRRTKENVESSEWWGESAVSRFPDRFWMLVTGLLVVTLPALTLLVAYVALTATRSVAIGRLTVVEAIELYLIEVVAFAAFSYLLYRLTLYTARRPMTETQEADDPPQTVAATAERSELE